MVQKMVDMACECGGRLTFTGTESTALKVRDVFVDVHDRPGCQVADAYDLEWLPKKVLTWEAYVQNDPVSLMSKINI